MSEKRDSAGSSGFELDYVDKDEVFRKEVMRNWSSYGSAMTPKDQYFRARLRCIIGIGVITVLLIVAGITLPLVLTKTEPPTEPPTEPTTTSPTTTNAPEVEGKCIAYYLLHFSALIFLQIEAIILTGGQDKRSAEVLHIDGSRWCSLPDLPETRHGHTQSGTEACGGDPPELWKSCVDFKNGSWVSSHTLKHPRVFHAAFSSPSGIVLLGGSDQSEGGSLSTELLDDVSDTSSLLEVCILNLIFPIEDIQYS